MSTIYRIKLARGKDQKIKTYQLIDGKYHALPSKDQPFLKRMLSSMDKRQYQVNQFFSPIVWSAITAAAGIKGLDYIVDKTATISEEMPVLGSPTGKIGLTALSTFLVYELGKYALLGTKKSRMPLINKIKYDGIWKTAHRKNAEMYEKDQEHEVGRTRKNLGYLKNLGLAAVLGSTILTGAAQNTFDNLRFNLSEVLYKNKPVTSLSQNQSQTLDGLLKKQDTPLAQKEEPQIEQKDEVADEVVFDLGKSTDSEMKKSIVEAELYRMTDSQWERKNLWQVKRRINSNYSTIITAEAKAEGIDPSLIKGMVCIESQGNNYAVSKAGAKGLMQLMPATARQYGVKNPFDAAQNIRGGIQKLKDLLVQCEGNVPLALTMYNCDNNAVNWAIKKAGSKDPFVFSPWLQKEAREYAIKILAASAYMVNGQAPEGEVTDEAEKSDSGFGSEFRYLNQNSKGKQVFSYTVKPGDTPIQIARRFNALDSETGDKYNEIIFKTDIVNTKGYFVGNAIRPNQTVYLVVSPRK